MSFPICFIGLGVMGAPMAAHLLKNDIKLFIYNRTKEKGQTLINQGAIWMDNPADAFKNASVVFTMVADDDALRLMTEEILKNPRPGGVHVDLGTTGPDLSRELMIKHREKGIEFISAPVYGKPDAAAEKKLLIGMAGHSEAKKRVLPFLELMSQKVYDFGEAPEVANTVKLAANFLTLSMVELLAESFSFVEKSGADTQAFHTFLSESLFQSPIVKNYGQLINNQNYEPAGFRMSLGLKDIDLLLQTADTLKVPLPMAGIIHDRLLTGLANHRGDMDWAAIALTQFEDSGITH